MLSDKYTHPNNTRQLRKIRREKLEERMKLETKERRKEANKIK